MSSDYYAAASPLTALSRLLEMESEVGVGGVESGDKTQHPSTINTAGPPQLPTIVSRKEGGPGPGQRLLKRQPKTLTTPTLTSLLRGMRGAARNTPGRSGQKEIRAPGRIGFCLPEPNSDSSDSGLNLNFLIVRRPERSFIGTRLPRPSLHRPHPQVILRTSIQPRKQRLKGPLTLPTSSP
jgi:hypothetical protein